VAGAAPYYEDVVAVLDDEGKRLLTRRESRTDPPNLFVRTVGRRSRASSPASPIPRRSWRA
jgi:hypothetical protein